MWEELYPKYIVPEVVGNYVKSDDYCKDVEAHSPSLKTRVPILASMPASRAAFLIPNVFAQVRMRTSASATRARARIDSGTEKDRLQYVNAGQ